MGTLASAIRPRLRDEPLDARALAHACGVAADWRAAGLAPTRRLSCLAAERCWDQARWAVVTYAWRFDGLERAPEAGGTA